MKFVPLNPERSKMLKAGALLVKRGKWQDQGGSAIPQFRDSATSKILLHSSL
jgi:hypothetical protein